MRKAKSDSIELFFKTYIQLVSVELDKLVNKQTTDISNIKKQKEDARRNPEYTAQRLTEYLDSLDKLIRRAENNRIGYLKKKRTLESINPKNVISKLKEDKNFDTFSVTNESQRLNLYTKMLRSGNRKIGEYRITITLDQSFHNGMPRFLVSNITYKSAKGDYSHWAISGRYCCLAEWTKDFQESLLSGNLVLFFEAFVHFVTLSPADHTYYSSKEEWFDGLIERSKEQEDQVRNGNVLSSNYDLSDEYTSDSLDDMDDDEDSDW